MLLCTNRANAILENADHSLMTAIQASQRSYVISDPNLPDNPIIFASKGFLDLSGYTLENTLGRNCRFLQGKNCALWISIIKSRDKPTHVYFLLTGSYIPLIRSWHWSSASWVAEGRNHGREGHLSVFAKLSSWWHSFLQSGLLRIY